MIGFQLFGMSHLAVWAVVAIVTAVCVAASRRDASGVVGRRIAILLAVVLVVDRLIVLMWASRQGILTLEHGLPMHLCDWTVIAVVLALLFQWRLAYVLAYFWGLAGTTQALLTPDIGFDFPDFRFITFFVSHGGVLVGVLFLTLTTPLRPRARSILVAFGWSNLYLAAALAVNFAVGANYGYLRAKPAHPSLLDYLGPWPWYIMSLEVLALLSFVIVYIPFYIMDRKTADA